MPLVPSVQVASTSAAARLVCLLLAIVCSSSRDHGLRSDCTTLASHHGAAHHKRSLAVVVAGFADVPAWVQRLPPEADVHFYSRQPVTGQSGNVVVPNEGLECLPYLQYILDHYEDLPEQVAFLHADAPRHDPNIVEHLTLVSPKADYISFASDYFTAHSWFVGGRDPGLPDVPVLWERLFGEPLPSVKGTYCCANLLVARARIRARPRGFYEDLRAYVDGSRAMRHEAMRAWLRKMRSRVARERLSRPSMIYCHVLERMWGKVFGDYAVVPQVNFTRAYGCG